MDTLEAMKQAKEHEKQGVAFYTNDPGARVQYMRPYPNGQGWQFWYETGDKAFIPDVPPDWQPVQEKPKVGEWYKETQGFFHAYKIIEVDEENNNVRVKYLDDGTEGNMDWGGPPFPEKITDHYALVFLEQGRIPDDFYDHDLYRIEGEIEIREILPGDSVISEKAVPVCFKENRLDLPRTNARETKR